MKHSAIWLMQDCTAAMSIVRYSIMGLPQSSGIEYSDNEPSA